MPNRSTRPGARALLLPLAAFALAPLLARAQLAPGFAQANQQGQPPPAGEKGQPPTPPGGAGGDGGTKPKAAMMVIEETSTAPEPPPPFPVGDEKTAIGEYVRSHADEVRDCYAKRLNDRPTLQGKLMVRFDIGPNGKVIGATAEGIPDTQLVSCVVGVVRKWEFEKPMSGGKLRVPFPFILKPEAAR